MASVRFRLVGGLGTVVLLLALPACSTLPAVPVEQEGKDLTPRPPSLQGKGEKEAVLPSPLRGGAGGEVLLPTLALGACQDDACQTESPFHAGLRSDLDLLWQDYGHFYDARGLGLLALGIGAAAPLANTPADRSIEHWYQTRIHDHAPGGLADATTWAGQLWVIAPLGVEAAALAGWAGADVDDGGLREWSNRSLRAIATGYPPVLGLYVALGASRPDRGDSRWHPFEDTHGVSGHTFIGAIPFLTAAEMTDSPFWKGSLLCGSFLTGWARLHEDRHYFSQVALGWWLAYLSVRAVDQTQIGRARLSVAPALGPAGPGLALHLQY